MLELYYNVGTDADADRSKLAFRIETRLFIDKANKNYAF